MSSEKETLSKGMNAFLQSLPSKVYDSLSKDDEGDPIKMINCEKCNKPCQVGRETNIFVYDKPPEYPVKALCDKCMDEEVFAKAKTVNN